MQACEEATQLIMTLTAQVAQLKQMASVEQIARQRIIECGEDVMNAWIKGEKHNQILHARWQQATDPKTIDKEFKRIAKEFEARQQEVQKARQVLEQHEKDQADPKMPTIRESAPAPAPKKQK
jgi:predicted Holliday junction resolvase-like endonuclease